MLDSDFVYICCPENAMNPAIEIGMVWQADRCLISGCNSRGTTGCSADALFRRCSRSLIRLARDRSYHIRPMVFVTARLSCGSRLSAPTAAQRLLLGLPQMKQPSRCNVQAEAEASVGRPNRNFGSSSIQFPRSSGGNADGSADFMNQRFANIGCLGRRGTGLGWMNGIHPDDRKRFEEGGARLRGR